jgi:hypothetical protein
MAGSQFPALNHGDGALGIPFCLHSLALRMVEFSAARAMRRLQRSAVFQDQSATQSLTVRVNTIRIKIKTPKR